MKADIAIIGGGASGLAAAVSAARSGAKNIYILEKQPRVGKKLLATGNGRCNLYNENACADAYFGSRSFADYALRSFSPFQAEKFFLSLGIMTRKTEDGLYYPMSNQASAVLDCLRETAKEAGVNEITGFSVSSVEGGIGKFRILSEDGKIVTAKRVILACGSMASPKNGGTNAFQMILKPLGHKIRPCFPVLTQLKTLPECVTGLKGLKYQGEISLYEKNTYIAGESGEILFGENSISGIAVMQLSLHAAERLAKGRKLFLRMRLLPMSFQETIVFLKKRIKNNPARPLEEFLTGVLQKRIGQNALKRIGIQSLSARCDSLSDEMIEKLSKELTEWTVPVTGIGGFDAAQVMLGGADTHDFVPETMESRLVPGLYAAGELMDITGPCGGYNLAWAWASGILAGRSAAKDL